VREAYGANYERLPILVGVAANSGVRQVAFKLQSATVLAQAKRSGSGAPKNRIVRVVEEANNIGVRGEDALECARRDAFTEPTEVATQQVVAGGVPGDGAIVAILNGANFG
jgi:hypothetical protein